MSIPLMCKHCGDFIGTREPNAMAFLAGDMSQIDSAIDINCPGRGNHPGPERTEKKVFFGLIRNVLQTYPETLTRSLWSEYCGPPEKMFLWVAMFGSKSSTGGLLVNHKWAWRRGFRCYGDGWEELVNEYKDDYTKKY